MPSPRTPHTRRLYEVLMHGQPVATTTVVSEVASLVPYGQAVRTAKRVRRLIPDSERHQLYESRRADDFQVGARRVARVSISNAIRNGWVVRDGGTLRLSV